MSMVWMVPGGLEGYNPCYNMLASSSKGENLFIRGFLPFVETY